jgi:hypothetical protein
LGGEFAGYTGKARHPEEMEIKITSGDDFD